MQAGMWDHLTTDLDDYIAGNRRSLHDFADFLKNVQFFFSTLHFQLMFVACLAAI